MKFKIGMELIINPDLNNGNETNLSYIIRSVYGLATNKTVFVVVPNDREYNPDIVCVVPKLEKGSKPKPAFCSRYIPYIPPINITLEDSLFED